MAFVASRDLHQLSEFLFSLYAVRATSTLIEHLPSTLLMLFHADFTTCFEADSRLMPGRWRSGRPIALAEDKHQILRNSYLRHPVVQHVRTAGAVGRALKLSDIVSRRQWRDREVYQEAYRPDGITAQLGVTMPTSAFQTISLVLHRRGLTDFTETDRTLLDLLRAHVAQAWHLIASPSPPMLLCRKIAPLR